MLHHPRLFCLTQVLKLPKAQDDGAREVGSEVESRGGVEEAIVDYSSNQNGQGLILVTRRGHILSTQLCGSNGDDLQFHWPAPERENCRLWNGLGVETRF